MTSVAPVFSLIALLLRHLTWSAFLCRKDNVFVSHFASSHGKDQVHALSDSLTPPASISVLAQDSLPKLCSPALADFQIPSSPHSPSLGKESGFGRFLATLRPKHKELLISPRPLNMAFFLLQPISSSPCPGQWSRGCVSSPSLSASFLTLCFPSMPVLCRYPSYVSQHNLQIFFFASPC